MNTIPLIFNERHIVYTTLGGKEEPSNILMPVTCVVIGKSARETREKLFLNLKAKGFEKIISVEHSETRLYSDGISEKFPDVKFIFTTEEVTEGDLINIGMAEAASPYVLVIKAESAVKDFNFTFNLAKILAKKNVLCVAPKIYMLDKTPLPVVFTPFVEFSKFVVHEDFNFSEDKSTLFPAFSQGFYDRDRFIKTGGFDYTIKSAYWQRLDFFMRSYLWGEKILLSSHFVLSYGEDVPEDEKTVEISYLRFYLKNLAPVFKTDHAVIPKSTFFSFKTRCSCGLAEAVNQFGMARFWVKENQYRFKTDASKLILDWEESNA